MRIRLAWGVAVAAALAGCGGASGPSLSAFKTGYLAAWPVHSQFGAELVGAIRTAPQKTNAELATEFQQLSDKASHEATQLSRLDPPDKYRTEVDQIIGGIGMVRSDLRAISIAASAGSASDARDATIKLIKDADHASTLNRTLTAKLGVRQS